jgi:HK97 family phage portal protein
MNPFAKVNSIIRYAFRNSGESTLASPSGDLLQSLIGFPASSGKAVTRVTAVRVATFLAGVKVLASDIAKMPLILRQTSVIDGRQRTSHAIDDPLYPILRFCPNSYQTSYQMRWFLASQLIMNSNCYCQKILDQAGDILALIPLQAWNMAPHWDRQTNPPTLLYRYSDGRGDIREFTQDQIWHVSALNMEGFGIEGSSIIMLAKEAISLLIAAEETAGRTFSNGLGMSGFLTSVSPDTAPTEIQAQNTLDRLRKDFSGSQNAGKFSYIPDMKFEKMTFTAKDSQLLESRKWDAQEIIRVLGGAPLLVKLGLGEQNSTYASSTAFLDEYFNTCLLPYTTAIEQSITRDLIPKKQWSTLYAKHDADVILRGSPKERAETNAVLINSWQMTPNEGRAIEDRDSIEGGDFLCGPSNGAIYDPVKGEFFIPGQKVPDPGDLNSANEEAGSKEPDEGGSDAEGAGEDSTSTNVPPTPAKKVPAKVPSKRLKALANSAVERIERKLAKSTVDAKFVAEVLNCPLDAAQTYCNTIYQTPEDVHAALMVLAMGEE